MIFNLFCVFLMALAALGDDYTPATDQNVLNVLTPLLNPLNGLLFDGLAAISNARTTKNKNKLPTLEKMMYYNYYAASVYYSYDNKDLSCKYCLKYKNDVSHHKVLNNNVHNTMALVTLSEKRQEIVVTFRGTLNIWNVILDALLISGTRSNAPEEIKIHQGFYIATMSLYEDVVRTVASYLKKRRKFKVVITGHSLGGAMARLLYFFLEYNKQFPRVTYELYTYGEPRGGNKYYADFMNSQPITTARAVARVDIVPHVPPTSIVGTKILIGDYYFHAQTEFWINGKEKQRFCKRTVYEDPTCSMSMGPAYSIVDHLTYFDTNLGSVLGQPLVTINLPLSILNPVDVLPPLPKTIENLISGTVGGLVSALGPVLG